MPEKLVNSASAPYGLKAIREIRATNDKKKPSERLAKKINDTHNYFHEVVDPIIGECITYLLCERPPDVPLAMLSYLKLKTEGKTLTPTSKEDKQTKKELKLYLAVNIGPIIAKIVNRIAIYQPSNVIEFISDELHSMIATEQAAATLIQEASEEQKHVEVTPEVTTAPIPVEQPPKETLVEEVPEVVPEVVKEPRLIQIAVLGAGGSGKSSIINTLQGNYASITRMRPTLGFRPTTVMLGEDTQVRFYDLGGGPKIRDIWNQYYHDIHGIIYVVDSSLDEEQMALSCALYTKSMQNDLLTHKPVLVFANKQEKDNVMTSTQIEDIFKMNEEGQTRKTMCCPCSSYVPDDVDDETFTADSRIESGVEMLLNSIIEDYDSINIKVLADMKIKAKEDANKRMQRERKVLKNKIAAAFVESIIPEIAADLNIIVDPETMLGEEEGLNFLAAEIGEDTTGLPQIGRDIAAGVGYQRLALQLLGALKAPIKKGKEPMSWEEIHTLVMDLRSELGLRKKDG